jgi:hypothetical protein
MDTVIDKKLEAMVRSIVKYDIGDLLAQELKIQMKPFLQIADDVRIGQDKITEQLREDRIDINQLREDSARGIQQNKVIIDNQNHQEDRVVEAVEKATEDIPEQVKKSVNKVLGNESFMDKILK